MSKILVIDDEGPTLDMFRLFLGAYGYSVFTAENGKRGLEIFEMETPSIVLTDIKMPGMDGFEVLKRIKEMNPRTEVIVITGHGDMDLALEALNLDAADFINKPIRKSALDAALRRAEERLKWTKKKPEEDILLQTEDDTAILDIKGILTSHSEPSLMSAYDKASAKAAKKLLIRFDEHCSITGTGIAILIQLLSKSMKKGQRVAIIGISENFKKIFDMVGITKMAIVFDREEDALRHFQ